MSPARYSSISYATLHFRWARIAHSCRTKRSSPIRKRNCLPSCQARQLASEARRALNCSAGSLWLLPSGQAMLISMETHSEPAREQGRFPPLRSVLKGHLTASTCSRPMESSFWVSGGRHSSPPCLFEMPLKTARAFGSEIDGVAKTSYHSIVAPTCPVPRKNSQLTSNLAAI